MKICILFVFFILSCCVCAAQDGVDFRALTFKEALEQAKTENKLVFVDCYTSWCGPCKQMAEKVFPQKKAGDYFNKKFVCVKYDVDKGEGPELAKRFEVRAYPTFLVIRQDGTLLHKTIGGADVDGIIGRVEESFDETKAYGALNARYEAGDRNKDFLLSYLNRLLGYYDSRAEKVSSELTAVLSDEEKVAPEYWFIYSDRKVSPEGSGHLRYLLENQERFNRTIGKEKVDEELDGRFSKRLLDMIGDKEQETSMQQLTKLGHEIAVLNLASNDKLQLYVKVVKLIKEGKISRLIKMGEREFDKLDVSQVPYVQVLDKIMASGTLKNKKDWQAIGEKLLARAQDENSKGMLQICLKYIESQLQHKEAE